MDGPPPQEEDFTQIPISDRLKHKNWKARVSAYEQLIKTFQTTASEVDPAFKPYLANPDLLKSMVMDANAVAQEKGVECVVTFVKFAGETAAKTREMIVPALVDKCLGSVRGGTKANAVELILQLVEMENGGAGVVTDLLPGLGAKQPKAVAGTVLALKELIRNFGTQTVPPVPVLKALPKIFAHTDKTVRAEGTSLAQALYQCIGAAIEPSLNDLKPVQVKELHEAFETMDKDGKGKGTFKAERMTRQQAREAEEAAAAGEDPSATVLEEAAPPDPRMFAEEVNIVSKLPSGYRAALGSTKWKERKEALDEIQNALNTPRIADAPELGDLVKALAARMGDANINCVMVAAACIEALAKGLMTAFGLYRETVVPPMLGRMKERKQNVVDSLGSALDAVFATTTLTDILNDIQPFLSDKNPQIKEGTLKFLHRCLQTTVMPPVPAQVKPLSEGLVNLLGDSAAPVRDEAALGLGTLMKIVGERALNPVIDPLEASRKAKVKEAFDQATVKCKVGSAAPKPPPPLPKAAAPPKKKAPLVKKDVVEEPTVSSPVSSSPPPSSLDAGMFDDPPAKPRGKPPARLMAKKPAASSATASAVKKPPAATAVSKSSKPVPVAPSSALDTFKYKHTPDDAEALIADLIPSSVSADFGDANWKTRLAALDEMASWLEGIIAEVDSEVVVRFIAKKGWNEKNFQVSTKIYGILSMLAEKCPSFGRSSVALSVPHLSEKLGDIKLKKPAGDALLLFAEKTSLSLVLTQAYDPLSKQKAPKVLADAITWINQALTDFGIAGLSLRNLIEFLKTGLKNSNAAVRSSATNALVTIRLFAGPGIKDLLEDLNPQLLQTISTEFDKVNDQPAPVPTRTSADFTSLPQSGAGEKSGKGGLGDPLDDLFPRVEIDKLLSGTTILTNAKSDAWKSRKEALEALQGILDVGSNKRLKSNMGEIGQVLKARVNDTNKVVQLLALDIVARIATGMNKPFEKHTKLLITPIATALADQKANIRAAALQTLTAIATACEGLDAMVNGLATGLETQNPLQRASLLGWIVDYFKENKIPSTLDLQSWVSPVVSCLEDRNGDVRKGAQAALPFVIASVGVDRVMKETGSLKPASRSMVVPLIQAAKASIPTSASAPSSKPPPIVHPKTAPENVKAASPEPPSPATAVPGAPAFGNGRSTGVRSRKIQPINSRPESSASLRDEEVVPTRLAKPGLGLKRPAASISTKSSTTPSPVQVHSTSPFSGSNPDAKKARLSKDSTKWIIDSNTVRKDLADILQHQMESHVSKDLIALLFSTHHNAINDYVAGLTMIAGCYEDTLAGEEKYGPSASEMTNILVSNADLFFKYVSLRVHEPQSNLVTKCLDVVDHVLALLRSANYQLSDQEALCFIPTFIHKLGDAREAVRVRVSQIIETLPKVYAYSRIFQLLIDHGLKSKVAKTRQGTLDELEGILKRAGIGACEPAKSFPVIASMIADKDANVRKSALAALSEGYMLVGDKIWSLVGPLAPKDKTQLEERLRRTPVPTSNESGHVQHSKTSRTTGTAGTASPISQPPRSAAAASLSRPASPSVAAVRSTPDSPSRSASPQGGLIRPKSMLPSRLGPLRGRPNVAATTASHLPAPSGRRALRPLNGSPTVLTAPPPEPEPEREQEQEQEQSSPIMAASDEVTIIISSILSHDPSRSVDALKKIQRILEVTPEDVQPSTPYVELSEHTEGLIETITLQMGHVFERSEAITEPEYFRLAKHLIQTLNAFCDHPLLAESLTVDIVTALLEELTTRLLQTDDNNDSKVKDLSRFINMIILRLFATGRRIIIFRALFNLLLQIVKPFPANGTTVDSREAKVAELVLKCVWKLARNIPSDLEKQLLDPVELFPAIEHFLQSIPPNEWRARATNKIPAGDMPLRTVKVIIQHIVAQHGDEVYEQLSTAFDDPSATIVYPYVYRILNASSRPLVEVPSRVQTLSAGGDAAARFSNGLVPSRPLSTDTASIASSSRFTYPAEHEPLRTPTKSSSEVRTSTQSSHLDDDDPDTQLLRIIQNISSETTGALHKEGITQLYRFLKTYPHKKPKVDKMLDSTGPAFRKYIARALASRAADDDERDLAVADTLSRLEAVRKDVPASPRSSTISSTSPGRTSVVSENEDPKLSRLHDLFGYQARSNRSSTGSASAVPTSLSSRANTSTTYHPNVEQADAIITQLSNLRTDS